jgi:hypothetical protein
MTRLTDSQIQDIKARVDLVDLAAKLGAQLRRSGGRHVGSCPACGGGKRATRFEIKADGWVCAVCSDGGDAIRLIRRVTGCDFAAAIERLGGARVLDAAEEQKLQRERATREVKRQKEQEAYRERERAASRRIWESGRAPSSMRLARYLGARGLALPATALVREAEGVAYFDGEEIDERGMRHPRLIARTPAMLALMLDNHDKPVGLHITHLAEDWSAKAQLFSPDTGELLPAKKMRGLKNASRIVLRDGGTRPGRLFLGEGIETCLSVAMALKACGRLRPDDAFWAAGDLQNIAGPALGTIPHPALTTKHGRAQRVPGPEPDREAPAIQIPASLHSLCLLGDGDSEPFLTRATLERARARHAREGLTIAIAMAEPGSDFNDMLRSAPS